MEKVLEMPLNSTTGSENSPVKVTPSQKPKGEKSQDSENSLKSITTPDPLEVPKALKYPERYRSPTDLMMSPVSKGLFARSRKTGVLLPPSKNPSKLLDPSFQDAGLLKS